MKFGYDRFEIQVTENNGVIKVIIEDTATKLRKKIRQVGLIKREGSAWVWSVNRIGTGAGTLWFQKRGVSASKQEAVETVQLYVRENIERGTADDNSQGDSVQGTVS